MYKINQFSLLLYEKFSGTNIVTSSYDHDFEGNKQTNKQKSRQYCLGFSAAKKMQSYITLFKSQ